MDLLGLATPFICYHFLALDEALVGIGVILLFLLLFKQFLNKIILLLLLVQALLSVSLIDSKLAPSTFALLSCKVALLLSFLDLVHSGGEREVLDLAGRNALLLFLPLNCIVNVNIGLNTKLLQIFIEFTDTMRHLRRCLIKLLGKLGFVQVDLSVFEVLLARNICCSNLLILFPI